MEQGVEANIDRIARAWGLAVPADFKMKLGAFFALLLSWNRRINLTGARSLEQLHGEHLIDSLALARLVPPSSSVVDVGSGGGLPIVPFRLLRPDCRLTLVEPRAKRVAFLRTAARELGFEASEILHGSDQEVEESAFSVATSRATFEPPSWLRIGQRLVDRNGLVAVFASSEFVPASGSWGVSESLVYQTESGARRWLGVFRST